VALSQPESKETMPSTDNKQQQGTTVESTGVQLVPIPATTAEEVKERCPPKAMVKPQVLTHVIEDFVIQESSEPFPVTRSALLGDLKPTQSSNDKESDEPPRKKRASSPSSNGIGMSPKGEMAKCEACGTVDLRIKFKRNKRFCSPICAKRYLILTRSFAFIYFCVVADTSLTTKSTSGTKTDLWKLMWIQAPPVLKVV
jgi:hypothetical protein